jgi:hypothetical protein
VGDRIVLTQLRRTLPRSLATTGLLLLFVFGGSPEPASADDSYIAGYAAALLERESRLTATIQVKDGVLTVYAFPSTPGDRRRILAVLEKIPGVVRAELVPSGTVPPSPPPPGTAVVETTIVQARHQFFPRGLLFEPLHADPRWPHFSAAYRTGTVGPDTGREFAGNFGETFALYRDAAPFNGQWEFGLQAGVFSLFDYGATSGSQDLINTDYFVALMASYRTGPLSGFLRLLHQSSHLGDEYILNSNGAANRLALSYEGFDVKVSYDALDWLRLYGGGGMIWNTSPSHLNPGTSEWGIELTCPQTFLRNTVRPVAYADFQANARTNWSVGSSIMAGIQFESLQILDRQVQVLFEYYGGPSPNGDFYVRHTEWFGIGLHFFL